MNKETLNLWANNIIGIGILITAGLLIFKIGVTTEAIQVVVRTQVVEPENVILVCVVTPDEMSIVQSRADCPDGAEVTMYQKAITLRFERVE